MPTLSDVRNWDTEHLTAAADHWSKTATTWEDVFTHYWQQVPNPGGQPWTGEAAEAAEQQAHSDRMIVIGLANQLHDASDIATAGANELKELCRLVIRSVEAAQNDGLTVGEDFSVSDHNVYSRAAAAMRQAKAEGYAADIRAAVADLVAADERIATALTTAASGLGKDHFGESGGGAGAQGGGDQKTVTDKLLGNAADGKPPQMYVDRNPLTIAEREAAAKDTKELQDELIKGAGTVLDAATSATGEVAKNLADKNPLLATLMDESTTGVSRYNALVAAPFTGLNIWKDVARDGENVWRATTREVSEAGYGMAIAKASSNLVKLVPQVGEALASGFSGVGAAAEVAGAAGVGVEVAEVGLGAGLLASGLEGAEAGALLGGPVGAAIGLGLGLAAAYFFADDAATLAGKAWDAVFG